MPVLVTAAADRLGRATVRRILEEGGEVRGYADPDADTASLRSAGAIVASGDVDDIGLLEAAMEQVHTVIHAGPGPLTADAVDAEHAARTVREAAVNAGVARLIVTLPAGADPAADEPLRRLAGRIEQDLGTAPLPTVIVRCSLVDEPALRDALATAPLREEHLATLVAPVREEDLIELLAALDAARSSKTEGHVVFAADGPRRMTLREYLERVEIPLPGAEGRMRGRRFTGPAEVPFLLDALTRPWVQENPILLDAWEFAGLTPHPPAA